MSTLSYNNERKEVFFLFFSFKLCPVEPSEVPTRANPSLTAPEKGREGFYGKSRRKEEEFSFFSFFHPINYHFSSFITPTYTTQSSVRQLSAVLYLPALVCVFGGGGSPFLLSEKVKRNVIWCARSISEPPCGLSTVWAERQMDACIT